MGVYQWRELSWPDFRGLPTERLLVVLPLGALEAHGPHLPLGTDIVIAEAMAAAGANRLARQGFEVVLLPALPVAPAPFAASFQGTIDTPQAATTALLCGIAQSAHRHGARALVIANAHHDPAHISAIRDAVRIAETEHAATVIFPDLTRRRWANRLTEEFRRGACHAGRYESSLVLAAAPDLVDVGLLRTLAPNPRSLVEAIQRGDRTFHDAGGPQAYFGWPADATAEEGYEIIERLGAILEEAVLEMITPHGERRAKNEERKTESEERGPETDKRGTDNGRPAEATPDVSSMPDAASPQVVNPESLGRPTGFSHGIVAPAGWRTVLVAGQTAADASGVITDDDFTAQFSAALGKVVEVVRAAGGGPSHVTRMTIYVTSLDTYRASRPRLADVWSGHMGRHYPAMTLVEVNGLVEPGAAVEIQADAAMPAEATRADTAAGPASHDNDQERRKSLRRSGDR